MAEERTFSLPLLRISRSLSMAVKAVGLGETVRHQFENNMLFKTMERFIAKKQVWGDCFFGNILQTYICISSFLVTQKLLTVWEFRLEKRPIVHSAQSEVQPQNSHECK